MTSSNVNPHASDSGGKLRAPAQQIVGWRESLARWFTGGLLRLDLLMPLLVVV
jgi:hypothetical protein